MQKNILLKTIDPNLGHTLVTLGIQMFQSALALTKKGAM
jgi:hypothetical protein